MEKPADPLLGGRFGRQVLREALHVRGSPRVLEVGCGNGTFARFVKGEVLPRSRLVCLDSSAQALRDFPHPLKDASLVCGDGTCLPIRDESVDIALCRTLLMNVANPSTIAAEMFRVSQRGGRIVIVEPDFLSQSGYSSAQGELELQRDLLLATAGNADLSFGPKALGVLRKFPLSDLKVWCYTILETSEMQRAIQPWRDRVARFRPQLGDDFEELYERAKLIDRHIRNQMRDGRYSFVLSFPMYVYVATKE